jgi:hypothetical protein
VLADDSHVAAGACQHLCAEVSQPTISENDDAIVPTERHLGRNLKGRGHRFRKDGSICRNRIRYDMQVTLRDSNEVRKGAVMIEDSNRRPVRAVSRPSRETGIALPAAAIDLSDDPPAGERTALGDPDEFVAENAAKPHVTSNELQVGFAHAGTQHLHERFTGCWYRFGSVGAEEHPIAFENNRPHELNGSL